ncbi:MAG: tetratricopeptide repeat protein [Bacteroidales bacterium]|nr:tetratricopeptide repeat protein [Bacteroidales bacterium]
MPHILKRIVVFIIILGSSLQLIFSQSNVHQWLSEANTYEELGQIDKAEEIYKKVLFTDSANAFAAYRCAILYLNANHHKAAIPLLHKVIRHAKTEEFPDAIYQLGLAYMSSGNYTKAHYWFDKAVEAAETNANSQHHIDKIIQQRNSAKFALEHQNDTVKSTIYHLPKPINSVDSEFNPVNYPGNKLVFSTFKTFFTDSFASIFDQTYLAEIQIAQAKTSGWNEPVNFDPRINHPKWFTANITFNRHFDVAIFSRCEDDFGKVGRCILYKSERKNGKWTKPDRLPDYLNRNGFTSTHPYLLDLDSLTILYFASDMPGSFGGMDIWYSILTDGKWQKPTNLGDRINTVGNELTPALRTDKPLLYFSSDWHQGFGGYDIFVAEGGLASWSPPKNMGLPINSQSNDLYYSPIKNSEDAYLSSNRIGSFTRPNADFCCSDIYLVSNELEVPNKLDSVPPNIEIVMDSIPVKIKKLLPISLYFDNDIPDPKSTADSTTTNYQELLEAYIDKRNIYKAEYSKGLEEELGQAAMDSIEMFFNKGIESGFEKLNILTKLLKAELESGKSVTLVVEGYASPLNTEEYNYHLSNRRINSLINFLYATENGYFISFLDGTDSLNRKMLILKNPMGDKTASAYVSSNPNDKRNSVYSKAAALERRIRITMYRNDQEIFTEELIKNLEIKTQFTQHQNIREGDLLKGVFSISNKNNVEVKISKIFADSTSIQFQPQAIVLKPKEEKKIYFLINEKESGNYQIKVKAKIQSLDHELLPIHFSIREAN